jgi:tRNA (guanine6-N2)-methyltransferase
MIPCVDLVARCLRGIERLCAEELRGLGGEVTGVEHRLVACRAASPARLLTAGTVDDLFLLAARLEAVDHRRSALAEAAAQAARAPVEALVAAAGAVRPVPADAPFEVVASFLGRRNYNRFEIERAVGEALERTTGRRFVPGPAAPGGHPPLTFRVHLYDGGGFLGLRLSAEPLHRRPYRRTSLEGALHPPLAYAAALLAGIGPGDLVVDPCCGAGTMLLEAARCQPAARLLAADVSAAALRAAAGNGIGPLVVADAGCLPVAGGAGAVVVTNPPWDRRVAPAGSLRDGLGPLWAEVARIGDRAAVVLEELEGHAGAIRAAGLRAVSLDRVAVSGAWTTLGLLSR